jgi:predicted nucleic acid-binding protein
VNALVIDASIAVKWVVEEEGTAAALSLRKRARLIAPDLLISECANILWKKVRRRELSKDEAILAARLLTDPTAARSGCPDRHRPGPSGP